MDGERAGRREKRRGRKEEKEGGRKRDRERERGEIDKVRVTSNLQQYNMTS